jgi:uncharacterized protein DUF4124
MRIPFLTCLLVITCATALPATAQQFYKWKDASGATHYSDHPPEKGQAKTVTVKNPDGTTPAPAPIATSGQAIDDAETAQRRRSCLTAKANLNILQGEGTVVDGKDVTTANVLTMQRRTAARDEAAANIDKYCGPKP